MWSAMGMTSVDHIARVMPAGDDRIAPRLVQLELQ